MKMMKTLQEHACFVLLGISQFVSHLPHIIIDVG